MFYYKCAQCQSEWNGIKLLESCPFCGTIVPTKISNFTKIEDALSYIFSVYGTEVVKENNRLVALLSDYAPKLERERKLIRVAMDFGVYVDLINVSKSDKAAQELSKKMTITKLHNEAFMDPVIAEQIIDWFISYLGWEKKNLDSKNTTSMTNNILFPNKVLNDINRVTTYKNIKVGDTIVFGLYPQENLTIPSGIEWEIISIDEMQALLLSKYCLDAVPYNKVKIKETWKYSDLRKWLNNNFINAAFSRKEQLSILSKVTLLSKNPRSGANAGEVVTDKVFVLSREEVATYNLEKSQLICQATNYARAKGAFCDSETYDAYWWLRTPGYTNESAMYVTKTGSLDELGCAIDLTDRSLRPAIWVDLDKMDSI